MLRVIKVAKSDDGYDVDVYNTRTVKTATITIPSEDFEKAAAAGTDLIVVVKEWYEKLVVPPSTAKRIEDLVNRNFNV